MNEFRWMNVGCGCALIGRCSGMTGVVGITQEGERDDGGSGG